MNASPFINPTAIETELVAAFQSRSRVEAHQTQAFDRFVKLGFPNRRVEGWKWSDLNAALRQVPTTPKEDAETDITPSSFAALHPLEFRIVNGRIELPPEALPEGIKYGIMDSMATIPALEAHAIASLTVAMVRKALGIEIEEGVKFERPILIRHINSGGGLSFAQSLMRVGQGSAVNIIETYEGEGSGFYAHLNHMALRDGAKVHRTVVQETGPSNIIHAICAVKADGASRYEQTSLSTGSRLSRHETHLHYVGSDASADLRSVALLSDNRHLDFTSHIYHLAEACSTRQLHKGVARDQGRTVFQGKFEVARSAQKTDAKMTANALLLSDMAEANHKPELEIYADDVECAHGSTVGALDPDALFYMRQRGLDEATARGLLIEAFLGEVMDGIDNDGVREVFSARVKSWLEAA